MCLLYSDRPNFILIMEKTLRIVACRLVARQRQRNIRDKQPSLGSYQHANGLDDLRSRGNPNRHQRNNGTATEKLFSTWSVQMGYKEGNWCKDDQFKSERLSANIKLTFHKALMRSVMTYAFLAWELAADTYLLKLQLLQNKVLRSIGYCLRRKPVRERQPHLLVREDVT
jgi:hypothetical protein